MCEKCDAIIESKGVNKLDPAHWPVKELDDLHHFSRMALGASCWNKWSKDVHKLPTDDEHGVFSQVMVRLISFNEELETNEAGYYLMPKFNFNLNGFQFPDFFTFEKCLFPDYFEMEEVYFRDKTDFTDCIFGKFISFHKSNFQGDVNFSGSSFAESSRFSRINFYGNANFSNCHFLPKASFDRAIFHGKADFQGTNFSYDFEGELEKSVRFYKAEFKGDIDFSRTQFGARAYFKLAKFGGVTDFILTEFDSHSNFQGCNFEMGVQFQNCNFKDYNQFQNIQFNTRCLFTNNTVNGSIDFSGGRVGGSIKFNETKFNGLLMMEDFRAEGAVSFDYCLFEGAENDINRGITIPDLSFTDFKIPPNLSFIHTDLPRRDNLSKFQRIMIKLGMKSIYKIPVRDKNAAAKLRRLKQLASDGHNHLAVIGFFRKEILASINHEVTNSGHIKLIKVFEAVSMCGQSIKRPLVWLAILWVMFASFYSFGMRSGVEQLTFGPQVGALLHFSGLNTLPFLGVVKGATSPVAEILFGPSLSGWVSMLSIIQNLISSVFLFLLLLGIRNRFKL